MRVSSIRVFLLISTGVAAHVVREHDSTEKESSLLRMPLVPYHVQQRRYRRRLESDSSQGSIRKKPMGEEISESRRSPLYQGYGTHFLDLWIGTPPQLQTVIIDTGSGVTAFPCQNCINCGAEYHMDSYFLEDSSASFEDVSCDKCSIASCSPSSDCKLRVSYEEGSSWTAHEVSDVVYLGGNRPSSESFRLRFGCQTALTGLFKTQLADGIMGLDLSTPSFWKQAYSENTIPNKSFSLCFSRQENVLDVSNVRIDSLDAAGVMTMGGSDPRLHDTIMVYADIPDSMEEYFNVHVVKMYLRPGGDGESVVPNNATIPTYEQIKISEGELNSGDIIVDSGTTNTYLTTALSRPFRDAWKSVTGGIWRDDLSVKSLEEVTAMPTILFQLRGWNKGDQDELAEALVSRVFPEISEDILVAMPPTHYMEYSAKKGAYSSRIYFGEDEGGVLGANFMMGHDILFDAENMRVGFAESTCEYHTVAEGR